MTRRYHASWLAARSARHSSPGRFRTGRARPSVLEDPRSIALGGQAGSKMELVCPRVLQACGALADDASQPSIGDVSGTTGHNLVLLPTADGERRFHD